MSVCVVIVTITISKQVFFILVERVQQETEDLEQLLQCECYIHACSYWFGKHIMFLISIW